MLFNYIENKNPEVLIKTTKLAKYVADREKSQQAYENYLLVLANTGQFKKAYDFCMSIADDKDFEYFALKCLSDKNFVKEGLVDNEKRKSILVKRLALAKIEPEIEYIKAELEKL